LLRTKEHNPRCIGERALKNHVNEEEERGKIAALHRMDQKPSRQKIEVLL